jgi:hypothetical protein
MGEVNSRIDDRSDTDVDGRGERDSALNTSEPEDTVIRADCETERNSDSELHLDGEDDKPDTLYRDGIDIEDDYDTLAGTDGSSATIP